ncbi:hypothetical protein [Frigidibacter sp. MR17.24]|uniref:hypothetical protein n=1 Tax=Frigidibacter sp. MR17.24 TaxID=3127345 RepID=UPI003012A8F6
MSKLVTMTPTRSQTGDYGRAMAHVPVQVDEATAKKLEKSKHWVRGLTPQAKAAQEAVEQRKAGEAARAAEATKAEAEKLTVEAAKKKAAN